MGLLSTIMILVRYVLRIGESNNLNKLGKPMLDCVRSELKNVDDKSLLEFIKPSISKDEIVSLFDEAIYLDKVNDKDNHKYNDRYTLSTQKKKEKEKKIKRK